jgi:hypothetical protein
MACNVAIFNFINYEYGDHNKEDVRRVLPTGERYATEFFVRKPEGKWQLEKHRPTWKDNIEMYLM